MAKKNSGSQTDESNLSPIVPNRRHFAPKDIDFNSILDQLYLCPCSGLFAIFSNVKINGQSQEVDVTRRIKIDSMSGWPKDVREEIYEILLNFSIKEFNHIMDLIKSDGVNEYDCYKIEKQLKNVTLPVHTHIYVLQKPLTFRQKLVPLGRKRLDTALLIFKKTDIFEHELQQTSSVIRGREFSDQEVDRIAITTYEPIEEKKEEYPSPFLKNNPEKEKQGKASKAISSEERENNQLIEALVHGNKKISYLSIQEQGRVLKQLQAKKSTKKITSSQLKLLRQLEAYRKELSSPQGK